jgi:hypothetical protein
MSPYRAERSLEEALERQGAQQRTPRSSSGGASDGDESSRGWRRANGSAAQSMHMVREARAAGQLTGGASNAALLQMLMTDTAQAS